MNNSPGGLNLGARFLLLAIGSALISALIELKVLKGRGVARSPEYLTV